MLEKLYKNFFYTLRLILISAIPLILFIGIFGCKGENIPTDKLSSELLQLATSENPEGFAKQHGIPLINNSVQIVIVTINEFPDITKHYDLKEIKIHKNLIEAIVPIEELVPLSKEEDVKYIRRPYKLWKL